MIRMGDKQQGAFEEESQKDKPDTEDRSLPPRRKSHPTERGKWTRRFYALLVLLFIALIITLIMWFLWKLE